MTTNMADLEKRVVALEQGMAFLEKSVADISGRITPAERGARLLAQARLDKVRLMAVATLAFEQMGAVQEAVPPEQLRAQMAACGVKAEDNLFSRGIRELRDE